MQLLGRQLLPQLLGRLLQLARQALQLPLLLCALLPLALEALQLALIALQPALQLLIVRVLRQLLSQLPLLVAQPLLLGGAGLLLLVLGGLERRLRQRARCLLALLLVPLLVDLLRLGGQLLQLLAGGGEILVLERGAGLA